MSERRIGRFWKASSGVGLKTGIKTFTGNKIYEIDVSFIIKILQQYYHQTISSTQFSKVQNILHKLEGWFRFRLCLNNRPIAIS